MGLKSRQKGFRSLIVLILFVFFGFATTALSADDIITTIAGNGTAGYSGDGGAAANAQITSPYGIATDSNGNIYFAAHLNHRIRKVDNNGIISTIAGTGVYGHSGDGGLAVNAQMKYPLGVATDKSGNLYFADYDDGTIRKVNISTGIISTVAGIPGSAGYSGDGGPAINAKLYFPHGVNVDSVGNLYISDSWNYAVRKVDSTTGIITTIAGGKPGNSGDGGTATNAQLCSPESVVIDSNGNLYIAESSMYMSCGSTRIRKINSSGIISTVAGDCVGGFSGDGGPAVNAQMNQPMGMALDSNGNLYIADYFNHRIRKVDSSGNISTVAGSGNYGVHTNGGFGGDGGVATSALLATPRSVALDSNGNLYIADYGNHRIRKVTFAPTCITQAQLDQKITEAVSSATASMYTKTQLDAAVSTATASMYTKTQLDQAVKTEQLKWDANGDGRIGLEDIIRMLQVLAGLRP